MGRPLLYLHGAAGAGAWTPFMEKLSDSFDLIVPEHPGFGASDTPPWLDNIHDLAYFYLDFLKFLNLGKVHLAGSSLGGWIALELAVRSSSRLKSLTVCSPGGISLKGLPPADSFLWPQEEQMDHLLFDQELARKISSAPLTEEEQDRALKNRFATAKLAWSPRLHDPNLHKWLHRIDVPTLIIWGDHDRLLPPAYASALRELIPNSTLAMIGECGHLPHTEKPEALCEAILRHIKEVGA